jgi:glycosyltransferase involved in cell wall biosynthesis
LADFFPLCPTLKLFDRSQQNCSLERPGQVCVRCCAKGPSDRRDLIAQTLLYRFKPLIKRLPRKVLGQIIRLPWRSLSEENAQRPLAQLKSPPYDERRLVNLERLKMIDLLIARSRRVEEIYRGYLGEADHLETINPTLRHIAGIRGQQIEVATGEPLRFVTLNGLASVAKGAEVLVEAVEELIGRGKGDCFELYAWGGLSAAFKGRIDNLPNIRFMGPYAVKELGAMLQGMHVGIVPSIWEEVFGYVGLELLAKGLPLIGNCKGGITEYVIDGETGFQNATCSAMELAGIMERFIENPSLVRAFNKKVLARRWYQTYETHVAVVQDAYAQVLSGGRNREHLLTLMREGK